MKNRTIYLTPISFLIVSFLFLSFISVKTPCESVKNGRFHFYQNNGQYHAIIIRNDSVQTEVNVSTGDSTFWRVAWISDCRFTVKYISGSKMKSQEELDFYNRSTLTFNILTTTEKYYTYNALFTSKDINKSFNDTMWLEAK